MSAKPSKADYGVDSPMVPLLRIVGGLVLVGLSVLSIGAGASVTGMAFPLLCGVLLLAAGGLFLHATRRGKFEVWSEVLDSLQLRGDEHLLDIGCGRGAVLVAAAKRLGPGGTAVGVDLWQGRDQSGNAEQVTQRNAELEGVAVPLRLITADMTELPFPDNSFDLVLSSLAIHVVPTAEGRAKAVAEAARVLAPGGRIAIADIRYARDYANELQRLGLTVTTRSLGWRFWFGVPMVGTYLVEARAA